MKDFEMEFMPTDKEYYKKLDKPKKINWGDLLFLTFFALFMILVLLTILKVWLE